MIKLGELVIILDLHRQGLWVSAIARQLGVDRKTVRTYIAKGLEPPAYKKRAPAPAIVDPFEPYLRERLATYPGLTAVRLWREIKERGFAGGYSVVRDRARDLRPIRAAGFARGRLEGGNPPKAVDAIGGAIGCRVADHDSFCVADGGTRRDGTRTTCCR